MFANRLPGIELSFLLFLTKCCQNELFPRLMSNMINLAKTKKVINIFHDTSVFLGLKIKTEQEELLIESWFDSH